MKSESLIGRTVSMDVSSGDHDAGHRLFGTVFGVENDVILCELFEDNKDHEPCPAETKMLQAMERYEWSCDDLGGCQSPGCVIRVPAAASSDDCLCWQDKAKAKQMMQAGQELYAAFGEYYPTRPELAERDADFMQTLNKFKPDAAGDN